MPSGYHQTSLLVNLTVVHHIFFLPVLTRRKVHWYFGQFVWRLFAEWRHAPGSDMSLITFANVELHRKIWGSYPSVVEELLTVHTFWQLFNINISVMITVDMTHLVNNCCLFGINYCQDLCFYTEDLYRWIL